MKLFFRLNLNLLPVCLLCLSVSLSCIMQFVHWFWGNWHLVCWGRHHAPSIDHHVTILCSCYDSVWYLIVLGRQLVRIHQAWVILLLLHDLNKLIILLLWCLVQLLLWSHVLTVLDFIAKSKSSRSLPLIVQALSRLQIVNSNLPVPLCRCWVQRGKISVLAVEHLLASACSILWGVELLLALIL